ncbi:hypothetical protein CDAR_596631 [Caerostris darwini]|uniref:Uncharacterized protein n=1 Tax=Caerostris darwini TaxID=1538125 RepID=A0AAV4WF63_9ARAC|nr:hypothetical protein CDAR_596631 [Caerostris darwini]
MDFHLRSLQRVMRKENVIVENGASRRKVYHPPWRTIRETNGPVLFHCATSSEPFVSFNAPESDGPPRACQKRGKSPLCEGRVENFQHFNQVPSIRFDLGGGGLDFHLRSLERVTWKENGAGIPSSRMGLQDEKNTHPPCRSIRETNGPVLFHCATSSEPFVSFNAPESDGPPGACQKRRKSALCEGRVDNFPHSNQVPSIRFDLGEVDGLPSSFSGKSNAEKKMTLSFHRREWGFRKKRIPSALSDNKGDEWSRFDPLRDVVRAAKKLLLNYDMRKESNTGNKLVVTVWDPGLNVLWFSFFVDRQLVTCCEGFLLNFWQSNDVGFAPLFRPILFAVFPSSKCTIYFGYRSIVIFHTLSHSILALEGSCPVKNVSDFPSNFPHLVHFSYTLQPNDLFIKYIVLFQLEKEGKSPLREGRVDNFPHFNQVPSNRFDLGGGGMDFHLRSLERVIRKENDAGAASSRMELQEEKNTIRPVGQ